MALKRDVSKVRPLLVETSSGQVICKEACRIQIPTRWLDVGLGSVGITTFVYGFFPIIVDSLGVYSVSNVPALIELNPFQTKPIKINDVDYTEFSFERGQVIYKSIDVIQKKTFIYDIVNELFLKGKIPWYASYKDVCTLLRFAKKYAGSDAANVDAVIELIASIVSRSPKSMKTYLRTALPNQEGADTSDILFVPLSSVVHSVNNTVNKLTGAYFSDGVVSALVHPSKKAEKIETILRS